MSGEQERSQIGNASLSGDCESDRLLDDPRLAEAAQQYAHELESGRRPDRRKWLDCYPELAQALGPCLDGLELVHQAALLAGPLCADLSPTKAAANEPVWTIPLGDFQIVREIGRGGMGIVYEAVQLSLGRRVALKVLPLAAAFDTKHLQRFRQEAQAAAQLHHTNIVPVYAVGCERGIHFYAMQLIEGQSLDAVIRQLRKESGLSEREGGEDDSSALRERKSRCFGSVSATGEWNPGPVGGSTTDEQQSTAVGSIGTAGATFSGHLSTRQGGKKADFYRAVARCMAQTAEALEYAHQQGVVHRDIKPANLLIDVAGNIWITDFGLAQFHNAPGLTQTGDVLGTIRYMSPEQASGGRVVLDHRTDIYSLAAAFYELLTLRPVFTDRGKHSLLYDVINRDPPPPRSLDRKIPAELEIIILKALNKSPPDRYASAHDLADDLHRFLRDEPIRAKRPSLLEKARKWSRRHPSLVVSAVLIMFLGLVGSLASNWLITQANQRTEAALAQERLRAEEAERNYRQTRDAVDLLIEIGRDELGARPPQRSLSKHILEKALAYYQEFIAQHRGDQSSQAELLEVENQLKKTLDDLAVREGAGQAILLLVPAVQDDLDLDRDQRDKIKSIAGGRFNPLGNYLQRSSAELDTRFLEVASGNDQMVRSTLSETQLLRLQQIHLQLQGLRAFNEPDVLEWLQLTTGQREQIRRIETEDFASLWFAGRGRRGPPSGNARQPGGRAALEKALAVLTPAQLAEWKRRTGRQFEGKVDLPPPGPWSRGHRGPQPPHGPRPPEAQ